MFQIVLNCPHVCKFPQLAMLRMGVQMTKSSQWSLYSLLQEVVARNYLSLNIVFSMKGDS